ncbi:hypothetical protein SBA5_580021 [Candidatus Sulfotelmatomonas gaucii]|uniref:Uncharacterized protein n=1 Tax=Candidatus Sulfuritelmatomonas gaucii TaxID=2043161 RepID=A0A2N9LV77_9BACT|nr:hypothetical protein SBA5_580021 [Candidatus Sulfotelmatomonas gaucii]
MRLNIRLVFSLHLGPLKAWEIYKLGGLKSFQLLIVRCAVSMSSHLAVMLRKRWRGRRTPPIAFVFDTAECFSGGHRNAKLVQLRRLVLVSIGLALFLVRAQGQSPIVSHTIQITNDADDGYYNSNDSSGWNDGLLSLGGHHARRL